MQTRPFIPMAAPAPTPVAQLKDGELPIPADHKRWPRSLSEVPRADAEQVREIYMNPIVTQATAANGFLIGTVFVMENYAAAANADGSLKTAADGKLVKGEFQRVFVMGKGPGWGDSAPPGLKNGDWIYAGYLPDGEQPPEPPSACRACHLPLTSKDFVHRYDEYFSQAAAE